MLQIKPSKKSLACLIAVAAVVLVAGGFAYVNLAARHGVLDKQIRAKEQKLANSEEITRRLFAVEQDYLDAQAKLGALEHGVSTRAYVPTLLRQIEALGKGVNMRVAGVRPKPVIESSPPPSSPASSADGDKKAVVVRKSPDPYDKLDIDIEVRGKYSDVMRFVYEITSFPKIIAVNSMQINPVGGKRVVSGSPMLSVRLGTTAFVLKETVGNESAKDKVAVDGLPAADSKTGEKT